MEAQKVVEVLGSFMPKIVRMCGDERYRKWIRISKNHECMITSTQVFKSLLQ